MKIRITFTEICSLITEHIKNKYNLTPGAGQWYVHNEAETKSKYGALSFEYDCVPANTTPSDNPTEVIPERKLTPEL